jgi:hypothetical protein
MTTLCDQCDDRIRLAEQDKTVEKVLDLCQAAELDVTIYPWKDGYSRVFQDGRLAAFREVAKLLKEPK